MDDAANRISRLERQLSELVSVVADLTERINAQQEILETNLLANESQLDIVGQVVTDVNFMSLYTYWFTHHLEHVQGIVPLGTMQIAVNNVAETMDPKEATFHSTFSHLWEDSRN